MSKISLSGNASGTGTLTIAAPNTNSNYTLDLPTSSGTMVVTGGAQTIEFGAGSASTPSITFTGDTNTGVFSPGADIIGIGTGGTERARFTAGGYFKASYNGTYDNSTGSYHEFTGNAAANPALFIYNNNASFTNYVTEVYSNRNTTDNTYYFLRFRVASVANRLTIADSGSISTAGSIQLGDAGAPPTSGVGVKFPATQSASTDANTLDDYEEGTWTPSLGGNTTYAGRYGTYTKIGNLVYVNFYVEVTTLGTGSTSTFSGLPFSGTSGQQGMGFSTYQANLAISPVSLGPTIVSSTSVRFDGRTAAAATASATLAIYGNGAAVYGSMVYTT